MNTRKIYLAVSGQSDQSFRSLAEAKEWLDKTSPETVGAFELEDGGRDFGVKTTIVRHADDDNADNEDENESERTDEIWERIGRGE